MIKQDEFFGEVISEYTAEQGIIDGLLMSNPKNDVFSECNLLTTNLFESLCVKGSNMHSVLGLLMYVARNIFEHSLYVGDNDEDFFVIPRFGDGLKIWFVRNEYGKLTAMLAEDY